MTKRKVSTSRTTSVFNPLTGRREHVTRTYAEVPRSGPSRTSRALAVAGVSPWQPRRAAVAGWVLLFLFLFGTAQALGLAFLFGSAAAFGVVRWRRSVATREAARLAALPPSPAVGPDWCDRCADWTTHETPQHA